MEWRRRAMATPSRDFRGGRSAMAAADASLCRPLRSSASSAVNQIEALPAVETDGEVCVAGRAASQPGSASVASRRAMVAVRRLPLSVGLLVLLAAAWRAQWAFQFVKPRANGGWALLAALLALFALW